MLPRSVAPVIVSVLILLTAACGDEDHGSLSGGSSVEGEPCGGWGAGACAAGLYCEFESVCAEVDGVGTCKAPPRRCAQDEPSVCGCDGQRFGNVCEALAAGLDGIIVGGFCAPGAEAVQPGGSVDSPDPA